MSPPFARHRIGISLALLARRWRRVLDERLAGAGLTDATWSPLMHLNNAGDGLRQKDLAARTGLRGPSLVRLIDILERDGLVTRRPDPTDRRVNRLHLTEAGRQSVERIRLRIESVEAEIFSGLREEDLNELVRTLSTIDLNLETMLSNNADE